MAITQTPGTTYSEVDTDPQANGTGAEIPIFIGISGNNNPTPGVQKFKKYEDARKTVSEHGIGTDVSTNPLLAALKDFFEEAKKVNSDDIGIPYVREKLFNWLGQDLTGMNVLDLAKVEAAAQPGIETV